MESIGSELIQTNSMGDFCGCFGKLRKLFKKAYRFQTISSNAEYKTKDVKGQPLLEYCVQARKQCCCCCNHPSSGLAKPYL